MVIKAVFFDFDGTISDAKGIALRSLSRTLEEFGYEFDEGKLEGLLGVKMGRMLKMLGLEVDDVEKIRDKFYKYFTEAAVNGGIKPCVSLKPLWKMSPRDDSGEPNEDGVPLIIVSNSRKSFLEASIKTLGIEGLFDKVYGADEFDFKDEMLRRLFGEMGILPGEAVYVGDRFSDVEFARKARCIAVAVSNKCSFSTLERLEKEKPDYIVRDFYGLRKVVRELNEG